MTAVLYAAKGGGSASDLYILDPADGSILSVVGPIGFAVTGLAIDPTTGILYGSTSANDPTHPFSIITINMVTGAGTFVAEIDNGGRPRPVPDITFDEFGQMYGWVSSVDKLAKINKATGVATLLTPTRPFTTFGSAIDFSPDGTLWSFIAGGPYIGWSPVLPWGNSYTADPVTGIATKQTRLTGGPVQTNPAVAAGKFDGDGVFWAIFNDFAAGSYLVTIDVSTGAVTSVATFATTGWDALCWQGITVEGCSLALAPTSLSIVQGTSGNTIVTSTLEGGPDSSVALTATGEPVGVTVSFAPTSIDEDGGTSIATVSVGVGVAVGAYSVTIHGLDENGHTCSKVLPFTVIEPVPVPGDGFSVRDRVPFN